MGLMGVTTSSVYPTFFLSYRIFLFWGKLRWTYVSKREKRREGEREGEREVEVAYTLQIHKSPCTTACLYAYIPFFSFLFSSPFFSFFLLLWGRKTRTALSVSSAREKRKQKNKEKRGGGGTKSRREGDFSFREGVFLLLLQILSSAYLPSLWRKRNEGEK